MFNALPEIRELALSIAENSVQGIVVMNEAGHCLYANRAWTELTGFTAEDMESKPVHDWVHYKHPDGSPFPIDDCPIGCTLGKNEIVRNHRDIFIKKDGSPFHVSCAASPIVIDGVPVLKILEIRDITQDVQMEQRKDEFLAMLAHELRNPLAPIAAATELLKVGSQDTAAVRRASNVISRQVQHMSGLVNDLLDVSRVTRGWIELAKEAVDIKPLVAEAVEQVRPLVEARRHWVAINTSPEPATVFGDRKRLVQVFANLLNNAVKYTPDGGDIAVSINVLRDVVQVSIEDNGIGMTAEMTECAFDLFTQAQRTPDRNQGGLGIGLALVRSLVTLHGGRVTARSDGLGKGAVLTVSLPRHVQGAADAPVRQADDMAGSAPPMKIMVVDDSKDSADMLAMLLSAKGHRVRVENDPHAALSAALVDPQDVFLLDVGLPGMDGIELARQLRQQPHHARALLVAITGYGQEKDRRNAIDGGFDHHLVKPANIRQIDDLLIRWRGREGSPGTYAEHQRQRQ